jgi:tetratricopeptide (TPR) repeat protein
VLGERHPEVATALEYLGGTLEGAGDPAGAAPLFRQALAIRQRTLGPAHTRTIHGIYRLASTLHQAGDFAAARPLFDEWIELVSTQPAEITATRADQLTQLGDLLDSQGDLARAEPLHRESLATLRALLGDRHPRVAAAYLLTAYDAFPESGTCLAF